MKSSIRFFVYFLALMTVSAGGMMTSFAAPVFAQGEDAPAADIGRLEGIAAVVNDSAISGFDVGARMKLIMESSGMPDRPEVRERLLPQVMNMLIDEQLKMQEARRLGLEVSDQEIQSGFNMLASQNRMSAEQFKDVLRKQDVPVKTLEDQVRAQIAWRKVVQRELRPRVTINDSQVEAQLERLISSKGKTEYFVSQIFLPVDNDQQESGVRNLADRLVRQMVEGRAPFSRLAVQFSQAVGATKGGEMGWIEEGQLPEELDTALSRMEAGELSPPIRTLSGYHILFLREKRAITDESIPENEEIRNKMGMEILDRLQRRYLLDLKSSAFIETRV